MFLIVTVNYISQKPKPLEKKKEYIVPLIKKVNWRVPSRHQKDVTESNKETKSEEEIALDKEAAAAIMKGVSL